MIILELIRNFNGKSYSLNGVWLKLIHYFCNVWRNNKPKMEETKDINRIKVVLVEKKRTNKWLAEQLGKDPATVSKWCTNTSQPGLETLLQIAGVLDVDVKDLLHSTKEDAMYIKVPTNLTM